jgi:hypothetical protein
METERHSLTTQKKETSPVDNGTNGKNGADGGPKNAGGRRFKLNALHAITVWSQVTKYFPSRYSENTKCLPTPARGRKATSLRPHKAKRLEQSSLF